MRLPEGSAALLCAAALLAAPLAADDQVDEYRLTVFPTHPILGSERWIALGYLGYVEIPEQDTVTGYLGTGAIWRVRPRKEVWLVLIGTRTDVQVGPDSAELRPLVGFKNVFQGDGPARVFNLARVEYRILGQEGAPDREYFRFRDRFGAEFPLSRPHWELHELYGLADVEGFYRFDQDRADRVRLRAGLGYIVNEYLRAELIYHLEFTRDPGESFEWTKNIFRLNFKVVRKKGLLRRLADMSFDAE